MRNHNNKILILFLLKNDVNNIKVKNNDNKNKINKYNNKINNKNKKPKQLKQ